MPRHIPSLMRSKLRGKQFCGCLLTKRRVLFAFYPSCRRALPLIRKLETLFWILKDDMKYTSGTVTLRVQLILDYTYFDHLYRSGMFCDIEPSQNSCSKYPAPSLNFLLNMSSPNAKHCLVLLSEIVISMLPVSSWAVVSQCYHVKEWVSTESVMSWQDTVLGLTLTRTHTAYRLDVLHN